MNVCSMRHGPMLPERTFEVNVTSERMFASRLVGC